MIFFRKIRAFLSKTCKTYLTFRWIIFSRSQIFGKYSPSTNYSVNWGRSLHATFWPVRRQMWCTSEIPWLNFGKQCPTTDTDNLWIKGKFRGHTMTDASNFNQIWDFSYFYIRIVCRSLNLIGFLHPYHRSTTNRCLNKNRGSLFANYPLKDKHDPDPILPWSIIYLIPVRKQF